MNILITTGCPYSGWEIALPVFRQFGLEDVRDRLDNWYNELFKETGSMDILQLNQPLYPDLDEAGMAMSLSSGDTRSPLLSADSRNLWLLDFWARTFPKARFLLLYTCPENALAYALRQSVEPEQFIAAWHTANSQLLRFQRRHRHRSLLLDAEAVTRYPEAVADVCERIGLVLPSVNSFSHDIDALALERLLAIQFLRDKPAIQTLQMELEASAQPLGVMATCESSQVTEAYQSYRQWQQQIEQLRNARDEKIKQVTECQAQLVEVNQSQESLMVANKHVEQENELLLLQLHQVQDELEHYFLKYQKLVQQPENEEVVEEAGNSRHALISEEAIVGKSSSKSRWNKLFKITNKARKRERRQINLLSSSGFFDEAWYLEKYPDVLEAGIDPVMHYLRYGAAEGRNPSPKFNTLFYLASNPDIAAAQINPLLHYVQFGRDEGRLPSSEGISQ